MKYLENRKYVIQGIFLVVGVLFALRLFYIQVVDSSYKQAAETNAIKPVIQYPFRGLIYDRNGKLLVQNTPVYDLMVIPKEVKDLDTLRLMELVNLPLEDVRERLKKARAFSYVQPSAFYQKLSTEDFARIQDNLIDFPGFYINARTARGYPHQSLAHALGYIAEISPKQLEDPTYKGYRPGDYIGKSGIELEYEKYLMGKRGVKYKMVNVRGVEKGSFKDGAYDTLSVAGENLVSTIDLDLQQYGEYLMNGAKGSVVAIEPSTGEVLAYVSSPFYDPNLFTGKEYGKNYMALLNEPNKTLFNRPIMASSNPPGSIFKLAQALIALQEGIITPNTGYPCNQSLVKCSHAHQAPTDLSIAIKTSCNPYFYQVFRAVLNQGKSKNTFKDTAIGLADWREQITSFGFGTKLGIDLPNEKQGIIASPDMYNKVYGENRWKFSTIYSLSIGQGELGVTPLQMANFMATIANRGYYITPHIIRSIGEKGKPLPEYQKRHYTTVESRHFTPVVEGMAAVVESGTGRNANLDKIGIKVCGKTGTAENPQGKDHAVFVAFAPKDDPKIAIAVYVENAGFGAQSAAPIAGLMIEKYLTDSVSRKPMEQWVLSRKYLEIK
ncbi:penicillin-binding protein 2 [Pontibacter ummariensis]|uniref:Penicillin-binding protein 2 n=1 Tax=Pontibacter ummariensis TaxID=1610492 RepID=A0A239HHJ5_9BACT|nr:penicillin-binding protein 2 [Pontibacter ummariensis]PRY10589.1 penicillin-binding protein 2 [Pontibacter ummariensis]SNS80518.1 penicillin-binding protein 2 [Pontibacter ummariensis]